MDIKDNRIDAGKAFDCRKSLFQRGRAKPTKDLPWFRVPLDPSLTLRMTHGGRPFPRGEAFGRERQKRTAEAVEPPLSSYNMIR